VGAGNNRDKGGGQMSDKSAENLRIFEMVRKVPDTAQKEIKGGRLSGMTDINPMWRIKALTEVFGPCGIGWKYTIDKQWLEQGVDGTIAAYCNISLFVKTQDGWSESIPGTGGSMYVAKESKGLYTDDECYKKALTDALSVACKALGVGADVYWSKDKTKYDTDAKAPDEPDPPRSKREPLNEALTAEDKAKLRQAISTDERKRLAESLLTKWGLKSSKEIPHSRVDEFVRELEGA
jgi:hypothetical protein